MSNYSRAAACMLGFLGASATTHADVTVTTDTRGKASIINVGGESVHRIKGARQRTDQLINGKPQVLIIDVKGKRFIDLDDKKKSASVTSLESIAAELQKVGAGTMDAKLTKTPQTKQVAGHSCTVHDIQVSMPFSPTGNAGDGMDLTMVLTGTVCLASDVPGLADYQAFYRAAADSGFIFGDPRVTKSPAGAAQARAYAALTRKMAEAGMALESHVMIDATGGNPMAAMMGRIAKSDITTTVTRIETGELAADAFEIPAGYKVKTR